MLAIPLDHYPAEFSEKEEGWVVPRTIPNWWIWISFTKKAVALEIFTTRAYGESRTTTSGFPGGVLLLVGWRERILDATQIAVEVIKGALEARVGVEPADWTFLSRDQVKEILAEVADALSDR